MAQGLIIDYLLDYSACCRRTKPSSSLSGSERRVSWFPCENLTLFSNQWWHSYSVNILAVLDGNKHQLSLFKFKKLLKILNLILCTQFKWMLSILNQAVSIWYDWSEISWIWLPSTWWKFCEVRNMFYITCSCYFMSYSIHIHIIKLCVSLKT